MIKLIDDFLNRITMYRLILYVMISLLAIAATLGFFHLLPFDPLAIIFSSLFLYFFSGFVNDLFAKTYKTPVNIESGYITALILALIITPAKSINDFIFLAVAATLAMASKYILVINHKHVFNPAAIAVAITAFGLNQSASWWVGNINLLPFVIIGGWFVVRKIQREDMVFSFLLTAVMVIVISAFFKGNSIVNTLNEVLLHSPLFFFGFIMLTEPATTPPTRTWQVIYGVLVGLGSIYSTPELALITGNIFSYLVSPKEKLLLTLKEKIKIASDTYDFIFPLKNKLSFVPGQYMEWTLAHEKADGRGNRRYFTLASSPTEDNIRIGVKFYEPSSSFKKALITMNDKKTVVAGARAGDFTLPADASKKLVFMAGGIGITPFRSMLKYLIDKNEKRDIVVFYSNKNETEIAYRDILDEAEKKLGVKTVYVLTEKTGRINENMIRQEVPDYKERCFYLSGPHAMVTGFETLLKNMGVPSNQIKTDFFPGYV